MKTQAYRRARTATPASIAIFCQSHHASAMTTMNISLPAPLKSFVDDQVTGRGYGSCSAYMRELIRHDRDRQHLRSLLLEGGESDPSATADTTYFETLRARVRRFAAAVVLWYVFTSTVAGLSALVTSAAIFRIPLTTVGGGV